MNSAEIRKFLDAYFERYNRFDFEGVVRDCYTEDAILESPLMKLHGREAILEWYHNYHKMIPSRLVPKGYIIGDNRAAVEQHIEFEKGRDLPDFLRPSLFEGPNGHYLRIVTLYDFRDGRIEKLCAYNFFAGNVTAEKAART